LPALALALAMAASAGCGGRRSPEEQAAVRAQDACIAALEPVSEGRPPSGEAVAMAVRHAEAAAEVDQRWSTLRSRMLDFRGRADNQESLDALVKECARVNQIVKERRGDVPPGASG